MGPVEGGVAVVGVLVSVLFTTLAGRRIRERARRARSGRTPDPLPEQ